MIDGADHNDLLNETIFEGNTDAFKQLQKYIAQGNIIGFLGAGASAPLYPTWTALLGTLLTECTQKGYLSARDELECRRLLGSDPLDLADTLENAFGKEIFRARLADAFREKPDRTTEVHSSLVRLNLKGAITLNYDNAHEVAYTQRTSSSPLRGRGQDRFIMNRWSQNEVFEHSTYPILHLHGDTSDPSSMVFTGDDYNRFYNGEPESLIRQFWTNKQMLVVGFGFTDPYMIRVMETVLRSLPSIERHFGIIGKRDDQTVTAIARQRFAKKYRMVPVFYRVKSNEDGSDDHSDLTKLLNALQPPVTSRGPITVTTKDGLNVIAIVGERTQHAPVMRSSVDGRAGDLARDLFVAPSGATLYVEPRIYEAGGTLNELSLMDIVSSDASFIVLSRPEYGATTLARRLALDLTSKGDEVQLHEAKALPNYKKKLLEFFSSQGVCSESSAVLVLDGVDLDRDERLIKEAIGTRLFSRMILIATLSEFNPGTTIPTDHFGHDFRVVTLSSLSRSDVRTVATQFLNTDDDVVVSSTVDRIYRDLLALCIPLTPSNIIMYLNVVHKEGDFHPINRVQIVNKFVSQLLQRPSDSFMDSFSAKNKMDVASAFVFSLFESRKTSFSEGDWFSFCSQYMASHLIEFDARSLLDDLLISRVMVRFGNQLAFRYKFFHIFFLGRHLSSRPQLLSSFVQDSQYLRFDGMVEVIAELSSDNSVLINHIVSNLQLALTEFSNRYVPDDADPFASLLWPVNEKNDEQLWTSLSKGIAAGPRKTSEVDELKRSLESERSTRNQTLVFQEFGNLERRLVAYHMALVGALRNSDSLDGETKRKAVLYAMKGYFCVFQVGLLFLPSIMKQRHFYWHGLLFNNRLEFADNDSESAKIAKAMVGVLCAVADKAAEEIGSRKLGEVYKLFARESLVDGFLRYVTFACLLRGKSRDWAFTAREIIGQMDRRAYYLRRMLSSAFSQFSDEINTGTEREELKRIVASIRVKRDRNKDRPSQTDITQFVKLLENGGYFKVRDKSEGGANPEDLERDD